MAPKQILLLNRELLNLIEGSLSEVEVLAELKGPFPETEFIEVEG